VHKAAFQRVAYFDKDLLLVNITTAVSPEKWRVLVGKPEVERPLGRSRHRWEDNIKMGLQEVGVRTGSDWLRIGAGGRHL
jgi:3-oxoacyl-ACP reductase-like protein